MNKLVSIFTTLCFMVSVIGTDIAHAIPANDAGMKSAENSISFIPFNLGRVVESKNFENSRYTVINIQDLHCHKEAQKNIEQIIESLQKTYKISAIFVEGGYDEVDTSIFGRVKDEKLRNNIIEGLFEKGRLTGAEYYYLKNDVKTPFYGLEDKNIHKQNLERLSTAMDNSGRYNEKLAEIKSEIEYLKAKYFTRENHKFTSTFESYKYGRMPMERYYALLRKYIEKLRQNDDKYNSLLSVSAAKYPVFNAYCALIKAGKNIDYNKATFEMQSLVNHLKENLSYNEYNKLSLATAGFSNIEELGSRLPELSRKYNININAGSSLGQLIAYIDASRKINPVEMLDEERRIAEDIRIAFSATSEEIEVSFLSDFFIYLESFLNTKITADDYEFFAKEYPRFEKIYAKYAFKNTLPELKDDVKFLTEYYSVNKDRNAIFIKNIEKRLTHTSSNEVVIVVTGGFHSEGLNRMFTKNRTSYISVMPSITQETKSAEENYNSFLAMSSAFAVQTFALPLASQSYRAEIAQMMIEQAADALRDIPYNEQNITFIIQNISEALGEKIEYNFAPDQTSVTLDNGFKITLKNTGGKIEIVASVNKEVLESNKIKLAESLKLSVDVIDKLSPREAAVLSVFNPRVSDLVNNLVAAAAKNNYVTGDGLIFYIETDSALPESIGKYDRETLRKMPEQNQTAVLNAYERDALFNSEERIISRIFLAAYSALGLDKAVLDAFYSEQALIREAEKEAASVTTQQVSAETESLIVQRVGASGVERFDIGMFDRGNLSESEVNENAKRVVAAVEGNNLLSMTFNRREGEDIVGYYKRIIDNVRAFSMAVDPAYLKGYPGLMGKGLSIREILRNAFAHGNHLDGKKYAYIFISDAKHSVTIINEQQSADFDRESARAKVAKKQGVYGQGRGMDSLVYNDHGQFVKRPADRPVEKLADGKEIFAVEFVIDVDFPPFAENGKLELDSSARRADKIGLKKDGWKRGLFVGVLEFHHSLMTPSWMFVAEHFPVYREFLNRAYESGDFNRIIAAENVVKRMINNGEEYAVMLQGAKKIKAATVAFSAVAAFSAYLFAAPAIALVAGTALTAFVANVVAHAYHNVKNKDDKLELDSYNPNYKGFLRSDTWRLYESNRRELRNESMTVDYTNPLTLTLDQFTGFKKRSKLEIKVYDRKNILEDSFMQNVVKIYYNGNYEFSHAFYVIGYGKRGEGIKIHGFNSGDTVILGSDAQNRHEFDFDRASNVAGSHTMIRFAGNNVEITDLSGKGTEVNWLNYNTWPQELDAEFYENEKRSLEAAQRQQAQANAKPEISKESGFKLSPAERNFLLSFFDVVEGKADKSGGELSDEIIALRYYVLKDLSSADISLTGLTGTRQFADSLASKKADFLATLTKEQLRVFEMLEKAKADIDSLQEITKESTEEIFLGALAYVQEYLGSAAASKKEISLNSADDILFLASLDLLFHNPDLLRIAINDADDLFADAQERYIWNSAFVKLLQENKSIFMQQYLYLNIMKGFSRAMYDFDAELAALAPEVLSANIEFANTYFPDAGNVPAHYLNHMRSIFNAFRSVYNAETDLKLESLINKSPITNPLISKFIEKLFFDVRKEKLTERLNYLLQKRAKDIKRKPVIGKEQHYKYELNKNDREIFHILSFMDKNNMEVSQKQLRSAFPDGITEYLHVLVKKDNNTYLTEVFESKDKYELKIRLLALLYLKINKQDVKASAISAITKEYRDLLRDDELFEVSNDFDLRALTAGMQILLMAEVEDAAGKEYAALLGYENIYEKIADAIVVNESKSKVAAHAGLVFNGPNNAQPSIIAHELGHNNLDVLVANMPSSKIVSDTFDEMYAYAFEGIVQAIRGIYTPYSEKFLTISLFNDDNMKEEQEEHDAALGFINYLQSLSMMTLGLFMWKPLAGAIVGFLKQNLSADTTQKEALRKFLTSYVEFFSSEFSGFDFSGFFKYAAVVQAGLEKKPFLMEKIRFAVSAPTTDALDVKDNSYGIKVLKNDLKLAETFHEYSQEELRLVFSGAEIGYLPILGYINSEDDFYMFKVLANDPGTNVKSRLFALNLLRAKTGEGDFGRLIRKFSDELAAGSITIDNNYDLKAVLTGIHSYLLQGENEAALFKRPDSFYKDLLTVTMIRPGEAKVTSVYVTDVSAESLKSLLIRLYRSAAANDRAFNILKTAVENLPDSFFEKINSMEEAGNETEAAAIQDTRQDRSSLALLELGSTAKKAEKLGLKDGWKRALLAGALEMPRMMFSLPLQFVLLHYADSSKEKRVTVISDDGKTRNEAFFARLKGARIIIFGSWILAVSAVAALAVIGLPAAWALLTPIVYNIFSHAYYNVKNPGAKLEVGSRTITEEVTAALESSGVQNVSLLASANTINSIIAANRAMRIFLPEKRADESLGEYYFYLTEHLDSFVNKIYEKENAQTAGLHDALKAMIINTLIHKNNLDLKEPVNIYIDKDAQIVKTASYAAGDAKKLAEDSEEIVLAKRTGLYAPEITADTMRGKGFYSRDQKYMRLDATVEVDGFSLEKRFSKQEEAELISQAVGASGVENHWLSESWLDVLSADSVDVNIAKKRLLAFEFPSLNENEPFEQYYNRVSEKIRIFSETVFSSEEYTDDKGARTAGKITDINDRKKMASNLEVMLMNAFYEGNGKQPSKDIYIYIDTAAKEIKVITSRQPRKYNKGFDLAESEQAAYFNGFQVNPSYNTFSKESKNISADGLIVDILTFNLGKVNRINALSESIVTQSGASDVQRVDSGRVSRITGNSKETLYVLNLPKSGNYWDIITYANEFAKSLFGSDAVNEKNVAYLDFMIRHAFVNGNKTNVSLPIFVHFDNESKTFRVSTMDEAAPLDEKAMKEAEKALLYDYDKIIPDMKYNGYYNTGREDFSRDSSANFFEFSFGRVDGGKIATETNASGIESFDLYADPKEVVKAINENKLIAINFPKREIKRNESYYDYFMRVKGAVSSFANKALEGETGTDAYKMAWALAAMLVNAFSEGDFNPSKTVYARIDKNSGSVKVYNVLNPAPATGNDFKNKQVQAAAVGAFGFSLSRKDMRKDGIVRQTDDKNAYARVTEFEIMRISRNTRTIEYQNENPLKISDEKGGEIFVIEKQGSNFAIVLGDRKIFLNPFENRFLSDSSGQKAIRVKVLNENSFEIEEMTGNVLNVNYRNAGSAQLELGYSKKIADSMGLKDGWWRGIVVGVLELVPSFFLFPVSFVLMHYNYKGGVRTADGRRASAEESYGYKFEDGVSVVSDYDGVKDESFFARLKGAKAIIYGTWLLSAAGIAGVSLFSVPAVWAITVPVIYNILRHAYHNAKNPNAKLEFGSYRQLSLFDNRNEALEERKALIASGVRSMSEVEMHAEELNHINQKIADALNTFSNEDLSTAFTDKEIPYLSVIKIRNNDKQLAKFIEETDNLSLKLFALMYLMRLNGSYDKTELLKEEFEKVIRSGGLKIENDFDMKAALAGYNLIASGLLKASDGRSIEFSAADNKKLHVAVNKVPFMLFEALALNSDDNHASMIERAINIINANIRGLNLDAKAAADLWKKGAEPENAVNKEEALFEEVDKEPLEIVDAEERVGLNGQPHYLGLTATGDWTDISREEYDAYLLKFRQASRQLQQTVRGSADSGQTSGSAADWEKARKEVQKRGFGVQEFIPNTGSIEYKLPNGNKIVIKKSFRNGDGFFEAFVINASGRVTRRAEVQFYSKADLKGEKTSVREFGKKVSAMFYAERGSSSTGDRLELRWTKAFLDKHQKLFEKRSKRRALATAILESPLVIFYSFFSMKEFVNIHPENMNTTDTQREATYEKRIKAAGMLRIATFMGFGAAILTVSSVLFLGLPVWLTIVAGTMPFIFNITPHFIYNKNNPDEELDINANPNIENNKKYRADLEQMRNGTAEERLKFKNIFIEAGVLKEGDFVDKPGQPVETTIIAAGNQKFQLSEIMDIMFDDSKQIKIDKEKNGRSGDGFIGLTYKGDDEREYALLFVVDFLKNCINKKPIDVEDNLIGKKINGAFIADNRRVVELAALSNNDRYKGAKHASIEYALHFISEDKKEEKISIREFSDAKTKAFKETGKTPAEVLKEIADGKKKPFVALYGGLAKITEENYVLVFEGLHGFYMPLNSAHNVGSSVVRFATCVPGFVKANNSMSGQNKDAIIKTVEIFKDNMENEINARIEAETADKQFLSLLQMRAKAFFARIEMLKVSEFLGQGVYTSLRGMINSDLRRLELSVAKEDIVTREYESIKGTRTLKIALKSLSKSIKDLKKAKALEAKLISRHMMQIIDEGINEAIRAEAESGVAYPTFESMTAASVSFFVQNLISSEHMDYLQDREYAPLIVDAIAEKLRGVVASEKFGNTKFDSEKLLDLLDATVIKQRQILEKIENSLPKSFLERRISTQAGIKTFINDKAAMNSLITEILKNVGYADEIESKYFDEYDAILNEGSINRMLYETLKVKIGMEAIKRSMISTRKVDNPENVIRELFGFASDSLGMKLMLNTAGVTLTLPETTRELERRGYKGIKKYLYVGIVEFWKLFSNSAKTFSLMHDNISELQYRQRIQRTRGVKALSIMLPAVVIIPVMLSGVLSAGLLFPPLVFFGGVFWHALNNYIEDRQVGAVKSFGAYSEGVLDEKLAFYNSSDDNKTEQAVKDVKFLIKHRAEIENLFSDPELYENGLILKYKSELFIESVFGAVLSSSDVAATSDLFGMIYALGRNTSSVVLQKYIISHIQNDIFFKKENKNKLKEYERMLKDFLSLNSDIISGKHDLNDTEFSYRVSNLKDISSVLLSIMTRTDEYDSMAAAAGLLKEVSIEKAYGSAAAQIFANVYLADFGYVPYEFVYKYMSEDDVVNLASMYNMSKDLSGFVKAAEKADIPPNVVSLYIQASAAMRQIYDVLKDETIPINYRLAALKTLAGNSYDFGMLELFINSVDGNVGGLEMEEALRSDLAVKASFFSDDLKNTLSDLSKKLMDDVSSSKRNIDNKDEFLNSKEFEILFTAAILEASKNKSDLDIFFALRSLQYSIGNKSDVEISVKLDDDGKTENISLPVNKQSETVSILRTVSDKLLKIASSKTLMIIAALVISLYGSNAFYGIINDKQKQYAAQGGIVAVDTQKAGSGAGMTIKDALLSVGLTTSKASGNIVVEAEQVANRVDASVEQLMPVTKEEGSTAAKTAVSLSKRIRLLFNGEADVITEPGIISTMDVKSSNAVHSNKTAAASSGVSLKVVFDGAAAGMFLRSAPRSAEGVRSILIGGLYKKSVSIAVRATQMVFSFFTALALWIGGFGALITSLILSGKVLVKRLSVNYKFMENGITPEDMELMGIQEINGEVSVPVYMINRMPTEKEEFKFKNTGVKINGKSVWVNSEGKSFVIFAENAELKDIEDAVKNDSRKVQTELAKFIRKSSGISLAGELSLDWINVNANAAKTSLNYDDDGSVRVNLSAQESLFASEVNDFMTGVRQVRNADTMAAVQNIYYFLDNVKTAADFDAVLSDFQKIGNGQIVLDYSVLKNNLSQSQIRDFFAAASMNGIKIIADLRGQDLSAGLKGYAEIGFDGALYNVSENALSIYDFALASDRAASVVQGYENSEQLVRELQKTQNIKILNNSEITAKIAADDRSIIDRIQILKILKGSSLLGALKRDRYTSDFVRNAAYGFTEENLKALNRVQLEEFARLLQAKDLSAVKNYLNLADTNSVTIYLNQNIGGNIENKADAANVQLAFLEGILEKMLVSKTVYGSIVNKDMEKNLGKALRMQMQSGVKADAAVSAEEFKEQVRRKTDIQTAGMKKADADIVFSRNLQSELSKEVKSLAEDAFVNRDAAALSGIIELIPAIAEVRINMNVDKSVSQFDVRQVRSMLTAA